MFPFGIPVPPKADPKPATPIVYVDLHYCTKCACHYSTRCPEHPIFSEKVRNPAKR